MDESHVGSTRSPVDTFDLMQRVIERVDFLEAHFGEKFDLVVQKQKAFLKTKDKLDDSELSMSTMI